MEEVAGRLRGECPGPRVVGVAAGVSVAAAVERLADRAVEELGRIDIWVRPAAHMHGFLNPHLHPPV